MFTKRWLKLVKQTKNHLFRIYITHLYKYIRRQTFYNFYFIHFFIHSFINLANAFMSIFYAHVRGEILGVGEYTRGKNTQKSLHSRSLGLQC